MDVIVKFVNSPADATNVKDYLEIAYKYLNNLNKFKQHMKEIRTRDIEEMLKQVDKDKGVEFFREMRAWT